MTDVQDVAVKGKPGRKPGVKPESKLVPINEALVRADVQALDELALVTKQHAAAVRAQAERVGYVLPADSDNPDIIARDIAANMRRSVEACLEVGKGLLVLKVAVGHGEFMRQLDALNINDGVARRFMQAALKFSNRATSHDLNKIGSQSKLFEIMVLDDEQVDELLLTGQTGELVLDKVSAMSVKELRTAVRGMKEDMDAAEKLLAKKDERINEKDAALVKLKRQIEKMTPDQKLAAVQKEATACMNECVFLVSQQLAAYLSELTQIGSSKVFCAGLLGQITLELASLREEFGLPDVSNAADLELARDVAAWAGSPHESGANAVPVKAEGVWPSVDSNALGA